MDWKLRLKIPGYHIGAQFKLVFKKRIGEEVIGVYNKIGNAYVPFLDYDNITDIKFLYPELRSLQKKYSLSNAYIFTTGRGFHVIFTDLLFYDEWLEVLHASSCDKDYKTVPQNNGQRAWVLRLTKKKENKIKFQTVLWHDSERANSKKIIGLLNRLGVPTTATNKTSLVVEDESPLLWARYEA